MRGQGGQGGQGRNQKLTTILFRFSIDNLLPYFKKRKI